MIPQIREINFPSYATLHQATVSLAEMGERTISTQVKIDGDIVPDFEGWELEFKGERFVLPYRDPQATKDNTTRNSLVDLVFQSWAIQQLKRYFFMSLSEVRTGVAIPDQYIASVTLPLEQFVELFNSVLKYYFGDKIRMDLFGMGTGIYSTNPVAVEINYTYIWDVLTKFHELFDIRWRFEYDATTDTYVIKAGYPAASIDDHDFEYGYKGGLLKFERQVQDETINNILLGRGGEKNVPYRYFKRVDEQNPSWAQDPDALYELKDIYFDRIRDINFRWYVRGWMQNDKRDKTWENAGYTYPQYTEQDCPADSLFAFRRGKTDAKFNPVEFVKDDESIAKYGERWGALDNNDEIFPTIQGIERPAGNRVDEIVDVSEIVTDDIDEAAKAAVTENSIGGTKTITRTVGPNASNTDGLRSNEFYIPEGKIGNIEFDWLLPAPALLVLDTSPGVVTVENVQTGDIVPAAGIPSGHYIVRVTLTVTNASTQSSIQGTYGLNSLKVVMSDENADAWKPTFDIWIKNIWATTQGASESDQAYAERVWAPILGDRTGGEAKVVFSDGFMAVSQDYEFPIVSYPVPDRTKSINGVPSEWKITLRKSDAEFDATGLYIPNSKTGGKPTAGDHFFFIGIDMPNQYVVWAEEEVNKAKVAKLEETKEINPVWVINLDKIRVHTLEDEDYGVLLADRLSAGCMVRTLDRRFTRGQALTLYVQSITYTWNEGDQVPNIEVVLSDKVLAVSNPIGKLSNEMQIVRSTYAKTADIEAVVRRVASPLFLKKTGESDTSISPTVFASKISSRNFRQGDIGGAGWGHYEDGDGDSVLELDKLIIRKEMRVNSLVANQITYIGGKQVLSAASINCTQVVDDGDYYYCYFDQKQGSVANLFEVGDFAMGQQFDPENLELRYYRFRVDEVGVDYIKLSKSVKDGAGIPQEGDVIVQYGNDTNSARQYVIIRDVIGGGYERMLSGLSTVTADGDEYYFAGRQSGQGPRWFVGDAAGEFAEYTNGRLNIKGRLTVMRSDGTYQSMADYIAAEKQLTDSLQAQIDGQIQSWSGNGQPLPAKDEQGQVDPSTANAPANGWTDDATRLKHFGDIYVDDLTGQGYRYTRLPNDGAFYWMRLSDEELAQALNDIQTLKEGMAGLQYLKQATNQGTLIDGGLVLTSLIQLGYNNGGVYNVMSGINGLLDTDLADPLKSIAAWYGGPMVDHEADDTATNFAKSLFRFDGSGYLASGNIGWDKNGSGHIPGIRWDGDAVIISGDVKLESLTGDSVTELITAVRRIISWFDEDANGDVYVRRKTVEGSLVARNFYSYGAITAGGVGSGGGGGGGGVDLDRVWESLANNTDKPDVKIHIAHIPIIPYSQISGTPEIPTVIDRARNLLDGNDLSYVDPESGEEITIDDPGVTGTVLWGAESANQVALSVNGVSKTLLKAQSLDGIFGRLGVLEGYFVGGSAYNAVRLGGHDANYFAAASVVDALVTGVSSVAGIEGDVTTTQIADALTAAGYKLTDTIYTLPKASANALGGIRVGNGLSIDADGILSVVGQTLGTVTRVDVGSSQYAPDTNGVVSLPAYPVVPTVVSAFTNDAGYISGITSAMVTTALGYTPFNAANFTQANIKSTLGISDWALADTKPSYDFSEIGSKPTTLAGYGITDAKFSSAGVADKIRITLGSSSHDVLTAHQSLAGYATESWVNQQGFITKAVNDLTNYYLKTETYTQDEVNSLIGAINQFRYEIAASTSAVTDPKSNVLYLIGPTGSGSDRYEEYVYPNATAGWTKIGDTSIDLSSYVNSVVASGSGNYVSGFSKSGNKLTLTLGTLPTTLPASDVYAWAKKANLDAADVPNLAISKITGLQDELDGKQPLDADLTAIAGLAGESGFLKKTAANTWTLDTNTYALASRTVNGHALTSDVTVTKGDVGLGKVDNMAAGEYFTLLDNSSNQLSITIGGTNKKLTVAFATNASTLENHAASYFGTASDVSTLQGYFTNGVANSAARLSGTDAYSIWGVEYWANGVPKSVTGRPNLYIGITRVQTTSQSQDLAGIGTIAASGLATIQGGISLGGQYNSKDSKLVWDAENNAWHLIGNFYADGFITAGGVGSGGGGGGIDINRMWESLTNNTDKPNVKINPAHIPDMASTYGYLKGNQNITLTGVVTGSGTTSIATSIADGALSIAKVNGLQTALNGKQATINDLSTIRERANEGHTIYGYFTDGILDLAHMPLDDRLSYVDPEAGEEITIEDAGETGTVLWGAESANQVSLSVNGVSKTLLKAQSLDGINSRLGVLEGYFIGGAAYNAIRLGGHDSNYFATATDLDALEVVVSGKQDTISDLATIRSQAAHGETAYGWGNHASAGYLTSVPTASADTLGLIKVGSGLVINNGVLSVTGQTQGTVTRVDVGSTQYSPDVNGVVGLPAYPTSLPASDVYAWAKAENKPSYAFSEISGKATASQVPNIESLANFGTRVYDATASRNANTVLAAPNGTNGAASFRALVAADIPSLTTAKISDLETWISGKAYITKAVNDLTNYYLKSEVESLIGAINQFHYEIYATLPATGEGNVLYLIGPSGSGADKYEEYVYANSTWTKIGETTIDLSSYVNSVVASGTGNYVAGFSKSGNTLTLTMGTLPTTIALANVTGADDLKAIEALTATSGYLKKTAANTNTWALVTDLTGVTAINTTDLAFGNNITVGRTLVPSGNLDLGSEQSPWDYIYGTHMIAHEVNIGPLEIYYDRNNDQGSIYIDDECSLGLSTHYGRIIIQDDSIEIGHNDTTHGFISLDSPTEVSGKLTITNKSNLASLFFGGESFYIRNNNGTFESNLSTVGTITSGVWHGTAIERAYLESGVQTSLGKADTAYQKPSAGIPKTDLASAVQTSLGLADTAVQPATLSEAISNVSGRVTTIENWFLSPELDELTVTSLNVIDVINGEAKSATRLSGTSAYSIWGVEYWADGVPKSVTGQPTLYIGTTRVQTSSQAQNLTGIGSITATGALTLSTTKRIYFGDTDHYLELDSTGFHFSHGVYSEGFMTAGGQGSGGGGSSIDLNRVWESLTNNTDFPNVTINPAHIPNITTDKVTDIETWISGKNYLTGNQSITLSGDVSGSGATSIAVTIGDGKVTNAKLANSYITIAGTSVSLGGVITAANLRSLLSINNVENTALSTWVGTDKITTLGTITTGVWNGSKITQDYLDDIGWNFVRNAATYDTEDYIHINS